jgi:hypothetical protein
LSFRLARNLSSEGLQTSWSDSKYNLLLCRNQFFQHKAVVCCRNMIELSQSTEEKIKKLFPPGLWAEVFTIIESECGDNLPFCGNLDKYQIERIRFAVLKLSEGDLKNLKESVKFAQCDWRDLLTASGFGDDIHAHKRWKI